MRALIWVAKDGRRIPCAELDTGHLRNIVRMLRRKGFVTPDEFFSCLAYACSGDTPDGACMAAESELAGMVPYAPLEVLEHELRKREGP